MLEYFNSHCMLIIYYIYYISYFLYFSKIKIKLIQDYKYESEYLF